MSIPPSTLDWSEALHTSVQILVLRLTPPLQWPAHLESWLDTDEHERLSRFRHADDRALYAISHLWLRQVLSQATGIAPQELSFEYGAHGKPRLRLPDTVPPLHFNLSHTRTCIAIALTRLAEVGVDVECDTPQIDVPSLQALVLHPTEHATVRTPDDFVRLWAMKEAYTKAQGAGLSLPFKQLLITLGEDNSFVVRDELQHQPTACHGSVCHYPPHDTLPGVTLACCVLSLAAPRFNLQTQQLDTLGSLPSRKTNEPASAGS